MYLVLMNILNVNILVNFYQNRITLINVEEECLIFWDIRKETLIHYFDMI